MADQRGNTAEQLERLLYALPLAARQGGGRLQELADALDTTCEQILRDLEEVTTRAYYHPAGGAEDLQILIDGDRVQIWTGGEFQRPVALSPLEAAALALGFRILAAEEDPTHRAELLARAVRLEACVADAPAEELARGVAVAAGERGQEDIAARVREAARTHHRCRIRYLKLGADAPEEREVDTYALVNAAAGWYLLAHCRARNALRAFRLDRVLDVDVLEDTYQVPTDFDPSAWVTPDGRLYWADREAEVVVRYSPRVADWMRERGPVEEQEDGSVLVRHRVGDMRWIAEHVLQYGVDAEVLMPEAGRRRVAELVGGIDAG